MTDDTSCESIRPAGLLLVDAARLLSAAGGRPGYALVLTKPPGSGILTTALKKGLLADVAKQQIVEVMAKLNSSAAEALEGLNVHALADITGFGLLGHLIEMTAGARIGARIYAEKVPVLDEVRSLASQRAYPGGASCNRERVEPKISCGPRRYPKW